MDLTELKKTMIPLYLEVREKHVELIGTGICVKYKDSSFIITASHVSKQFSENSLFVPEFTDNSTSFKLNSVEGSNLYFPSENPDIGCFCLKNEIKGFKFFNFEDICLSKNCFPEMILYGYPCSKNKQKETIMPAHLYSIQAAISSISRANAKLKDYEFPLDFDKNKVICEGKIITAPDLNGMSGGPIFAASDDKNFFLFGIIEEYNDNKKILNGQKILIGIYASIFRAFFEKILKTKGQN